MTTNTTFLTGTPAFTALFNAHEEAALAFHDASQADMETTDKAQWEALQTTMGEAYTALMDFIDAHTQASPSPPVLPAASTPRPLPELQSIQDSETYDVALMAYAYAIEKHHDACRIRPGTPEYPAYEAAAAVCTTCFAALAAVIDVHTAQQVQAAVQQILPTLAAASRPNVRVRANIGEDMHFDRLFAAAQNACFAGIEADRAGLEDSDPAQWNALDIELGRTYHALLNYLNACIEQGPQEAQATPTTQEAA